MVETLVGWVTSTLSGIMPKELIVFIISMLPILELRGGILAASALGVPILKANIICIIGNLIPVPFILLFITKIFDLIRKTKLFRPLVEKLEAKAMGKKDKIENAQFWGLVFFVGIPLPGTGAWTGCLIAALIGVPLKKSIPAVLIGVLMASCIMNLIAYGIPWLTTLF